MQKSFPLPIQLLKKMSLNETHIIFKFISILKHRSYIPFNQGKNYNPELHFYQREANVVISELKSNLTGMIQ